MATTDLPRVAGTGEGALLERGIVPEGDPRRQVAAPAFRVILRSCENVPLGHTQTDAGVNSVVGDCELLLQLPGGVVRVTSQVGKDRRSVRSDWAGLNRAYQRADLYRLHPEVDVVRVEDPDV